MSATDLSKMIASASDFCAEMFARTGEIAAMWHAVRRNGDNMITPHPTSVDKDTAAAMMRALFEQQDVVRCLFISEAWIGESDDQAGIKKLQAWVEEYGSIEDYPGRVEVVAFMAEDIEAGQITAHRRIERAGGLSRLGPLEVDDLISVESSGRMVGMLPRSKAAVH